MYAALEQTTSRGSVWNLAAKAKILASQHFAYLHRICLLYTSDAADEEDSVDLGGRRIPTHSIPTCSPSIAVANNVR